MGRSGSPHRGTEARTEPCDRLRRRTGFTLIEILVAIPIIILLTLFGTGIVEIRESANRVTCRNTLRRVGSEASDRILDVRCLASAPATRDREAYRDKLLSDRAANDGDYLLAGPRRFSREYF